MTLTGSGCCSMLVVIARSLLLRPLSARSFLLLGRIGWELALLDSVLKDTRLRDVLDIKVSPVGGQKVIQIEAYVVPEISTIQNGHVEFAKGEYPHLKDLWFSDVCKGSDELEIDVLVGADYLWNFQKECTIRGNPDEPVAVETELGWVLSGPMKCKSNDDVVSTQVNLITSVRDQTFESEVHKLWDLETLGINPLKEEVHEEFRESISFDGSRN